jgi:hypothetical protein
MKKTAIRFGLYGVYVIIALFVINWFVTGGERGNFKTGEVIGWTGILISVIFVYFGLKYYREHQNGGRLSFGEGMKLGLLIVLIPSLAFGLFNLIYVKVIDPEFLNAYYNYEVAQIKASNTGAELERKLSQMAEDKKMFEGPVIPFVAMFFSVFLVGLVVTIISTLLLRRRTGAAVVRDRQQVTA